MEEFQQGLGEAWAAVATFLPKLLGFVLILVIGYVVMKLVQKAVGKVLTSVGFDRAVERGGIRRALARTEYDASDLLAKVIFSVGMLFVLQLAFGVFGPNPVSELIQGVIAYLPMVLAAIVIVVVGSAIAAAVRDIIDAAIGGLSYGRTLANVAAGAILVITAFAALDQLRVAPTVVNGLFIGLLAIVVGSSIVAFGGGGITVARRYLERWAERADEESENISQAMEGSQERIRARARAREAELKDETAPPAATQPPTPASPAAETRPIPQAEVDLREADVGRRS
jgi:hypothetical protein